MASYNKRRKVIAPYTPVPIVQFLTEKKVKGLSHKYQGGDINRYGENYRKNFEINI